MVFSKLSWAALGFGALGVLGCAGADFEPTAQGEETAGESQGLTTSGTTTTTKSVLSLGDSIAFGYNPLLMPPFTPAPPASPSAFIGYPEFIATKGYTVTNASCPGESSKSLLDATAPDTGCRSFKASLALHADYETTQLAYVIARMQAQNAANAKLDDFVTFNIGANDLFLLEGACSNDPTCIANGLPAVVTAYSQNLENAYSQIKAVADKNKKSTKVYIVGLTTYATNYNDPQAVGALTAMNNALRSFTTSKGGKVAEGFDKFKAESAKNGAGGDACKAGLLIKKPDNTCDIHPSQKGREILGQAVIDQVKLFPPK
jgi:lysophospholipase L1-like esterase